MADAVKFNAAELDALKGLPHAARVAYMEGIRPFMDYVTGFVGVKSGKAKAISIQSISEALYVEPAPGRKQTGSLTRKQVRGIIGLLISAGLLVSHSTSGTGNNQLILKCVLADTDESVQKKEGLVRAEEKGLVRAEVKTNNTNGLGGVGTVEEGRANNAQQGIPPDTVTYIHQTTPRAREVTIPADFEISDFALFRCKSIGVSREFVEQVFPDFVLANGRSRWMSNNWDLELVKYCKKQWVAHEAKKSSAVPDSGIDGFVTMEDFDNEQA